MYCLPSKCFSCFSALLPSLDYLHLLLMAVDLLKALPISFCLKPGLKQIGYDQTSLELQTDVHFKPKGLKLSSMMRVAALD